MRARTFDKELCFLTLYAKFIKDSASGRRLQPNGRRLAAGTVKSYMCTLNLLKEFCEKKTFHLRICRERHLNIRDAEREKNYWKKFYRQFLDFLYIDCKFFDNYTGHTIKNVKTFFNYLNKDLALGVGAFHKQFYVPKEEIAIFPLMPEELNFLIYNKDFEKCLPYRLQEAKDVFVFGCTVALRVSDLLALKRTNLRITSGQHFLIVRSMKTGTDSAIKLPQYAIEILQKYFTSNGKLLPAFNKVNLNQYIKRLLERAGFTHEVVISREKKGRRTEIRRDIGQKKEAFRFCDVASTHTMRRTAITTMLCLGMPEQLVRKVSGHAPHSKEFFRYSLWSQAYQNAELELMFAKLKKKGWSETSDRSIRED